MNLGIEDNGTLKVTNRKSGKVYKDLLVFEDCADVGEGWNYKKPVMDSRYLSLGSKFDFSIEYDGPLTVCLKLIHNLRLPIRMHENGLQRAEEIDKLQITTFIVLERNSPKLQFKSIINNTISEHRVRVLFPTYMNASTFYTSTPFYLQQRDVNKGDWSDYKEVETNVFPNQGIIIIRDKKDSVGFYNKGLYEVEVTEDLSRTIALTLFRSFKGEVGRNEGYMSFMKREMTFEYALDFYLGEISVSEIMTAGDKWRTGTKAICVDSHEGLEDTRGSFLKVNIPGAVLSAFRTVSSGMKTVRLYNCTDDSTKGEIVICKNPQKAFLLKF